MYMCIRYDTEWCRSSKFEESPVYDHTLRSLLLSSSPLSLGPNPSPLAALINAHHGVGGEITFWLGLDKCHFSERSTTLHRGAPGEISRWVDGFFPSKARRSLAGCKSERETVTTAGMSRPLRVGIRGIVRLSPRLGENSCCHAASFVDSKESSNQYVLPVCGNNLRWYLLHWLCLFIKIELLPS